MIRHAAPAGHLLAPNDLRLTPGSEGALEGVSGGAEAAGPA
jgi:hypothetical protein